MSGTAFTVTVSASIIDTFKEADKMTNRRNRVQERKEGRIMYLRKHRK